jgi:tungstate transport system ATP-binding protein
MNSDVLAYSVRSLIHLYDGKTVLEIPSLDIPSGEICVLTGPNGSGKTTLLSILALLLPPYAGSVRLYGVEASGTRDPHLRRKVTMVHQKPILFSTTVRNNIAYGLHAIGLSLGEIKSRTEWTLDAAHLRSVSEHQAKKLSGGETQRVVLARGLVLETPILLLDEPTNSLDDASRPVLFEMLREAMARATTVVIATHDPSIVASLNPRSIRLEAGRIVSDSRA